MQLAACALAFALLAAQGGAAAVARLGLRAQSTYARNWLRLHGPAPQQDELAELKTENPEAYAIVNALLTKRSLGLLDPKHPTASFAAPPPSKDDSSSESGANVFAAFATPPPAAAEMPVAALSSGSSTAVYPEVAAAAPRHSQRDWLNWKPADSAADDDQAVKNVLGAVAGLTAGKAASAAPVVDAPADVPVATVATGASTSDGAASSGAASASLGWGDVFKTMQGAQQGLGGKPLAPLPTEAPRAQAPAAEDNSFQGFDLKHDFDPPSKGDAPQSALASFSWGVDAPKDTDEAPAAAAAQAPQQAPAPPAAAPAAQPAEPAAPAATPAPKKEKKNMLLAWLGGGGAALRPPGQEAQATPRNQEQKPQPAAPAQETNPYLDMMK